MASMRTATVTTIAGIQMPRLVYGTAWKKELTSDLVVKAISVGFRGIDTACQPKHYQEALVGEALAIVHEKLGVQRKDIFVQTKFTSLDGQDPLRIPYDADASLPEQVRQSFSNSLKNLRTTYIDSLLIHSPMKTHQETMAVWNVFEEFHGQGEVKQLGISNVYKLETLEKIFADAKVKPAVIQNRFYADTGYDSEIRVFCRKHGIIYQSFWTLTGNPHLLKSHAVKSMAEKRGITPAQLIFRFVLDLGIVPLTGTTSEQHMREDLDVLNIEPLSSEDIGHIEQVMIREFSAHHQ